MTNCNVNMVCFISFPELISFYTIKCLRFLAVFLFLNSIGKLASVLKQFAQFNYIFKRFFAFFKSEKIELFLSQNEIRHD